MKQALTLVPFSPNWAPPDVLPDLSSAEAIAIDLETCDPGMKTHGPGWPTKNGFIVGFALAVDGWKGYLPVKHERGGNLDDKRVRKYVQDVLNLPCDKIFFNAAYDIGWLKAEGFTINGNLYDAMVAAALVDEHRISYSLNNLAFDYLKEIKSEEGLRRAAAEFGLDPKAELWKLPAMYVGEYAEQDAALTLKFWYEMKKEMVKEEVTNVFELEMDLLPSLIDMTMRGIRIDTKKAERTLASMRKTETDLLKEIERICGVRVDIWAAASIAKAFTALGLPYGKTEKGAASFTKSFLSSHPHELPRLIVQAREFNKASGTFVEKLLDFAKADGRIHAHINQIRSDDGGTVTGRFSMNNPNLQQIPARNETIGPLIRGLFLPEEGEQWASLDFSQQEPRIAVHYASLRRLPGADDAAEAYRNDPNTDFHQMVADMAKIHRKQAKTIGLGLMYGMGKSKMAAELDLEENEASALIRQFHEEVPFMRSLIAAVQEKINRDGSSGAIRTLLGRRCRFPLWEPVGYGLHKALPYERAEQEYGLPLRRAYSYKGLNRLIQGSAADQTKKAIVECVRECNALPLVQVHDELCFSVKSREQAEELRRVMETCVELEVPSKVDLEMGPSWGEAT
jgi:DNA polymerase I-like protein with 3'-5' exonuclease and polymerase domains